MPYYSGLNDWLNELLKQGNGGTGKMQSLVLPWRFNSSDAH